MRRRETLTGSGGSGRISPLLARISRTLLLASAVTLFLQSAATFDAGFTVRVPYVLGLLALFVGLPFALRGWLSMPPWLTVLGVALVLVYVVATLLGDQQTLGTSDRGGSLRSIVYLGDIVFGLLLIGLVCGLWSQGGNLRDLTIALAVGGVLAAAYALYQWPAQHYGWPFSEVLNTLDSTGTTEAANQGAGLLGWERVRGTFLEPHFLGAFLSGTLPILVALAPAARRSVRVLLGFLAVLLLVALGLTSSVPSWAVLAAATLFSAILAAIAFRKPLLAAGGTALAALALLQGVYILSSPAALASLTGRDPETLAITTDFRTRTWENMVDLWSVRPVTGYGAGQSAVRLTILVEGADAPALSSAQGLWAAALVDAGVLGFGVMLAFFCGIVGLGVAAALLRPSMALVALTGAALAGLLSAAVATDRLDQRVWIVLGLLLAAAFRSFDRAPVRR